MTKKSFSTLLAAVAVGALATAALAQQASESQIPTSGDKVDGAPMEVKRDWGTFKLADRIAEKIKANQPINYVFSYQASGIPLFSPQYKAGFEMGCLRPILRPAPFSCGWRSRSHRGFPT